VKDQVRGYFWGNNPVGGSVRFCPVLYPAYRPTHRHSPPKWPSSDKDYQHWVHLWENHLRIAHPSRQTGSRSEPGSPVDPWEHEREEGL
jgi:hypothetical protein